MSWAPLAGAQSRVGPNPLGQTATPMPEEVEALSEKAIEQNLGATLPLDVPLVDENGRAVTLGDYFTGNRPVLIEFAYFNCPLLCPLMMSGIADAVREVNATRSSWLPGEHFEILTISFDPSDTPDRAGEQKRLALNMLAQPDAAGTVASPGVQAATQDGWHFLTGRPEDVRRITDTAGFYFVAVPQTQDFAHGAVILFASPQGQITRYLPGHKYPVRDVRLALTEAAEGTQGSIFEMVLQLCYKYDPTLGTYTASAMRIMQLGGVLTVAILAVVIGGMLYFERQRNRRLNENPNPAGP